MQTNQLNTQPVFISAVRIALIYAFFAGLWILFSDMALESMVKDVALMTRLQTYKGWFFVLVTAVMLCFLIFSALLKIERINEFDPLTGLLNHHMFMEQLNRKIATRTLNQKVVVIYQDIDHFARINEALGFDQANQALADYARELKASLHSNVLIARFPPDQFAIKAKAIVDAIIGMSHGFGIDSVAEGIESQCQLDLLKAIGCTEGQGYFLAMPMTIDKLIAHIGMGQR